VRRARALGFTLGEVRALVELSLGRETSCAKVRGLAALHLADVRTKLAALRAMERVLEGTIEQCDRAAEPGCPLIAALANDDEVSGQ
jgi:MerR family mercuric resistance operon transcriptional regulator